MSYRITDECIACAACEPECEAGAISEEGEIFAVDPRRCDDCGTCMEVCPVEACVPVGGGGKRKDRASIAGEDHHNVTSW